MNIVIFDNKQELYEAAAGVFISQLHLQPRSVFGLATGSTPIGVYNELVKAFQRGLVSFNQATTFNLDEYVGIPREHQESYWTYMRKNLFDHIDIPEEQRHLLNSQAPNLEQECNRFEDLLKQYPLDVQLLGIGHNGHIGFNEPGESLLSSTHMVTLDSRTREANARFFNSMDEVPEHALTMGVGSILKAKHILLLATGPDKADAIHAAVKGPITTACPASFLQAHPSVTIMLDKDAGRLVS